VGSVRVDPRIRLKCAGLHADSEIEMSELDATVFQRYADYLWRRAGGIVQRWTVGGALLGSALGGVMLTSWAHWPVPHREAYLLIALGAVSGAVLGRSLARTRALGLLLQAQLAQHQLEFERSTLARASAPRQVEAPRLAVLSPPYLPLGAPPVSVGAPVEHESYGWAGLDPSAS
jgi:hypothetical protein